MQRAHAIANGVFVAAVNRVGTEEAGIRFWGQSFVADPFGRVLARASSDEEEVLVVECDLEAQIERVRRDWPFLRDRRIDAYGDLLQPLPRLAVASLGESPASLGFRWPAEWEPHDATWLSWPHNRETWPGCLEAAEAAFVEMVHVLHEAEAVQVNVADAALEARARRALAAGGVDASDGHGIHFHRIPTDDAWVRDHGPTFVVRDRAGTRELAVLDLGFDAWGGKYPPWDRDAAVPDAIARALQLPLLRMEGVLEGGAIDGDGAGTVLTTEACLLHANRGGLDRAGAERRLAAALGARHVVWLEGGILGDDTDGHVDDVARFVAPGTVVVTVPDDPDHPDAEVLGSAEGRLRSAHDAAGRPLRVETLPVPPPQTGPGGEMLPASYANFYLANGVCLVPAFGAPEDQRAVERLQALLPGRKVAPIESRALVVGLGSVHCLTQQQPAASALAG